MKVWLLIVWWLYNPTGPWIEEAYTTEAKCLEVSAKLNDSRDRVSYCKPLKVLE